MVDRWEHKIEIWEEPPLPYEGAEKMHRRQAEQMLDRFGNDGWELVNIRYHAIDPHPQVWTIWKRRKL